ncbi:MULTISPECIES: DUF11 domain-containing protein [Bacillus cereus group]|uniref:DUF11 domain-containing protein n=1 Tax=Bacillus cereus group TaxID=86661 RepID=UPI000BFD84DD|nr:MULTISPECIES: DUF11 domain-containing protein [Bacillus cereus group]PGQ49856.1 cell surface protein [Bacillus thuringiensis]PGV71790.1 cell surface protein [Bacillus cereus]
MIFNRTGRFALKLLGNTFGNGCTISLEKYSYILQAELILLTYSHLKGDIELKAYGKTHIITCKDEKTNEFPHFFIYTIDVTHLISYAGKTTYVIDFPEHSDHCLPEEQEPIWSLAIIYGDSSFPVRHVSLLTGEHVPLKSPIVFSELLVPSRGPNNGILHLFGKKQKELLSIPLVSFGPNTNQSPIPFPLTNLIDETGHLSKCILNQEVDISTTLLPAQSEATIHLPSNPVDIISFLAIGLQINSVEPKMNSIHSANKKNVQINDIVTYTTTITNTGTATAECIQFRTSFPVGTEFISDSLIINKTPISADPSQGVILRNMPVGDSLIVVYQMKVITIPSTGFILHQTVLDYNFTSLPNTLLVGNQPSNLSKIYVHA